MVEVLRSLREQKKVEDEGKVFARTMWRVLRSLREQKEVEIKRKIGERKEIKQKTVGTIEKIVILQGNGRSIEK